MLQFGIVPTCELLNLLKLLCLETNHATDVMKAIVHTVDMKFRKLKKNNVSNTNKSWQLKQEMLESHYSLTTLRTQQQKTISVSLLWDVI